jgi:chitinase
MISVFSGTKTDDIYNSVLPGGKIAPPAKPEACKPAEASLCFTTTSFATSVSKGVTKTTATQVKSTCATITGCNLPDVEHTKTVKQCKLTKRAVDAFEMPEATGLPTKRHLVKRSDPDFSCETGGEDGVVLLKDPQNVFWRANVLRILENRETVLSGKGMEGEFKEFRANDLKFTAFFTVRNMGPVAYDYFNSEECPDVS